MKHSVTLFDVGKKPLIQTYRFSQWEMQTKHSDTALYEVGNQCQTLIIVSTWTQQLPCVSLTSTKLLLKLNELLRTPYSWDLLVCSFYFFSSFILDCCVSAAEQKWEWWACQLFFCSKKVFLSEYRKCCISKEWRGWGTQ